MEGGERWSFAPHVAFEWPPDVNVTVCALAALIRAGHTDTGTHICELLNKQSSPSGLLYTWLVHKDKLNDRINDTDPVVTANAAWLMHRLKKSNQRLLFRIEQAIYEYIKEQNTWDLKSLYYKQPTTIAFFLSRWAETSGSAVARKVIAWLSERLKTIEIESLSAAELAALMCAAIWTKSNELAAQINPLLISMQNPDGTWPNSAFFQDPGGDLYGSEEISTALGVTALGLWLKSTNDLSFAAVFSKKKKP
jgi:hypothetical protein